MPARWPTSAMVVSQLPRCPAATLQRVLRHCAIERRHEHERQRGERAPKRPASAHRYLLEATSPVQSAGRSPLLFLCAIALRQSVWLGALRASIAGHVVSAGVTRRSATSSSADAERGPVRGLRHDALERPELDVRDARRKRSDGCAAVAHRARRIDHDAAELRDRDDRSRPAVSRERSAIGPIVSHIAMSWFGMPVMPVWLPCFIASRSCR